MNFFQTIKKSLTTLGLGQNQRPFNRLQLKFTLNSLTIMILEYIYLFHVASTAKEYMDALFMSSASTLFLIAFLSSIFKMTTISISMNMSEKTIEKREFCVEIKRCSNIFVKIGGIFLIQDWFIQH